MNPEQASAEPEDEHLGTLAGVPLWARMLEQQIPSAVERAGHGDSERRNSAVALHRLLFGQQRLGLA